MSASARDQAVSEPLVLWYERPAGADWLRALPVGNGRLGAMVFGNVRDERLALNEDTLWGGGPHDYTTMLARRTDLSQVEHLSTDEWTGTFREFDQPTTDVLLRQTVGEVPASVRLLLELARDGVALTPGGRLPRALVRQVQQQRPQWCHADPAKLVAVEANSPPLAALHDLLRQAGLLRLRKGVLTPTRASRDDLHVLRRLRFWLGTDEFSALVLDLTVATVAIRDPLDLGKLAAAVFAQLGLCWIADDGNPITEQHVHQTISRHSAVARGLDLIEIQRGIWRPGRSARWLLPRATTLAQRWSRAPRPEYLPRVDADQFTWL